MHAYQMEVWVKFKKFWGRPEKFKSKEKAPGALQLPARWSKLLLVVVGCVLADAAFWHYVFLRELRTVEGLKFGPELTMLPEEFAIGRRAHLAFIQRKVALQPVFALAQALSLLLYIRPIVYHGARHGAFRWFRSTNELVVTCLYLVVVGLFLSAKMLLNVMYEYSMAGIPVNWCALGIGRCPVTAAKKTFLRWNSTPAMLMAIAFFLERGGRLLIYAYAGFLVLANFFPSLVEPFSAVSRFEEGPVREQVTALAARIGFPTDRIFQVHAPDGAANALLTGFGRMKRIYVFDSIKASAGEVAAIVAHELGHWWHSDIPWQQALQTGLNFLFAVPFVYSVRHGWIFESFGFDKTAWPVIPAFHIFQIVMQPVASVLYVLKHAVVRRAEFRADAFAASLGFREELRQALIRLHRMDCALPVHDPLYDKVRRSHPMLLDRLRALREAVPEPPPVSAGPRDPPAVAKTAGFLEADPEQPRPKASEPGFVLEPGFVAPGALAGDIVAAGRLPSDAPQTTGAAEQPNGL